MIQAISPASQSTRGLRSGVAPLGDGAPTTVAVCANCATAALMPPGARLPDGWEPFRAGDYGGDHWCRECLLALIGSTLAVLRTPGIGARIERSLAACDAADGKCDADAPCIACDDEWGWDDMSD